MSAFVSLPSIATEQEQAFKVKLDGEVYRQFKAYQLAYKKTFGQTARPDTLLRQLVEFGLRKDSKFRNWYQKNTDTLELEDEA